MALRYRKQLYFLTFPLILTDKAIFLKLFEFYHYPLKGSMLIFQFS